MRMNDPGIVVGGKAFCLPLAFSDLVDMIGAGEGVGAALDFMADLVGAAATGAGAEAGAGASPSNRTSTVAFLLYGAERGFEPFDFDLPCLPIVIKVYDR